MSLSHKEIRTLEKKIADGTPPRCPLCGDRITVGKKQAGISGAIGVQYRCANHECQLIPGHAYTPWYSVLIRALQKRAFQLALAAIGSITIGGILGIATGVINWKWAANNSAPIKNNPNSLELTYYADSNDFLKTRDVGLFAHISQAREDLWFVGVHFSVTLADGDIRKLLIRKLEEGVSVRFLIFDPTSHDAQLVAEQYGRENTTNLFRDCQTTIKYLIEIYDIAKAKGLTRNVEIKLYREVPQSRLYVFDSNNPNSYTYFVPHLGLHRASELPGYLFRNGSVIREYRTAITRLWESGDASGISTLDVWLSKTESKEWIVKNR